MNKKIAEYWKNLDKESEYKIFTELKKVLREYRLTIKQGIKSK